MATVSALPTKLYSTAVLSTLQKDLKASAAL